jgi:nitrogen fixation NifU-like protein
MSGGEGALDKYWEYLKENYKQQYSETAADHMIFPRNTGEIIKHNGFSILQDEDGNSLAIWIEIENNTVTNVSFSSQDCIVCTACGSAGTEIIRGQNINTALSITPEDIIRALDGLPEENKPCAMLAANAIKTAVEDYLSTNKATN